MVIEDDYGTRGVKLGFESFTPPEILVFEANISEIIPSILQNGQQRFQNGASQDRL